MPNDGKLAWNPSPSESLDKNILTSVDKPFSPEGGLRLLKGNLGRGVIKVSAVAEENQVVEAPAVVIDVRMIWSPYLNLGH